MFGLRISKSVIMMKLAYQLTRAKRSLSKKFLGLFSLSTMLFVFQACYGTPQDFGMDFQIKGTVTHQETGAAIPGIKVELRNLPQFTTTGENGDFSIYCPILDQYLVSFSDIDGESNGLFIDKDTLILSDLSSSVKEINISLLPR